MELIEIEDKIMYRQCKIETKLDSQSEALLEKYIQANQGFL